MRFKLTWLALSTGQGDESPPAYIEQAFRRYLDCGILANGFASAPCDECGHDFLTNHPWRQSPIGNARDGNRVTL